MGKTRLLTRAAELAAGTGATVVWSHCVDLGEVGLPYLPFSEALTTLRAQHPAVDETVAARPALARLLDAGTPADDEQSQGERLQLFESVAAAIAASGTPEAPLVLVVEDLHWADPSSRDVLRFVVARLRAEHVLVVASYRADDLHRRHPLRPVLAELLRHPRVEHVQLSPFTERELRSSPRRSPAARCRPRRSSPCARAPRGTPTSPRSSSSPAWETSCRGPSRTCCAPAWKGSTRPSSTSCASRRSRGAR